MKKILFGFLTVLGLCTTFAADLQYSVAVNFTGIPVAGNSITINGNTRTFVASVTSPSTQILIGVSAAETATNYFNQAKTYPYTDIFPPAQNVTTVSLGGKINKVITASRTGSWGTVTVTSTPLTEFTVTVPLAATTAGTNVASKLVSGMAYATNSFPSATVALSNFVSKTGNQMITGLNIYSNAYQLFTGGMVSNVNAYEIHFRGEGNEAGMRFWDLDDLSSWKIKPGTDGFPGLYSWNGTAWIAASYTPEGASILNKTIGNLVYGQLAANNTWTGNNTFNGRIANNSEIYGGYVSNTVVTNVTIYAKNTATLTDVFIRGIASISNAAPRLNIVDVDGGVDEKKWAIVADGGKLSFKTISDDDLTEDFFMEATRAGTTATVRFNYGVDGLTLTTDSYIGGGSIVAAGTKLPTIPAGMTKGFLAANGVGLTADPASGVAAWSAGSELFYRTATASEGAGQNNRVHNRGAEIVGSGADYTLTGSYARVDFGGTDPEILLPTAGTYLLEATVSVTESGAAANDSISAKFYNSTIAADVANSVAGISYLPASSTGQLILRSIVTLTIPSTMQVYAANNTAARGTIKALETKLSYVRLY